MTALSECPSCGSELIQPLRWEQRPDGEVLVELRCPECFTFMHASHTQAEMAELDRRQSRSREQIVNAYEQTVEANMTALVNDLHEALERDLVGPDDFRPPPRPKADRRDDGFPQAA